VARLKSNAKKKREPSGRIDLEGQQELELPAFITKKPKAEPQPVAAEQPKLEPPEPPIAAKPEASPQQMVDASEAFKNQIAALRQAEERQAQAIAFQNFLQTPEGRRELQLMEFKQRGLSQEEEIFLRQHPDMIDRPDLLAYAHAMTTQGGVARDAENFLPTLKQAFDHLLNPPQQSQPAPAPQAAPEQEASKSESEPERVPELVDPRTVPVPVPMPNDPEPQELSPAEQFFRPQHLRTPDVNDDERGQIVSAPVSRQAPSGAYGRQRVDLSPAEREVARLNGLTDAEYAAGKLRLMSEKRAGNRQ